MIVERAEAVAKTLPEGGTSLACFAEAALCDVSPHDVTGIVEALHGKCVIWRRKGRGEVRVYGERPASIAGSFGEAGPAEACLAAYVPHLCLATRALADREEAKAAGDFVEAEAGRDRLSAACGRLVAIVQGHVARGQSFEAIRATLWANWVPGTLEAVALFEPAMSRESLASLAPPAIATRKRIPGGLVLVEKVAALVAKSGAQGITKSGLLQSIRPKPTASELAGLLDGLAAEGRIEARTVRSAGSPRDAQRFFAPSIEAPELCRPMACRTALG